MDNLLQRCAKYDVDESVVASSNANVGGELELDTKHVDTNEQQTPRGNGVIAIIDIDIIIDIIIGINAITHSWRTKEAT